MKHLAKREYLTHLLKSTARAGGSLVWIGCGLGCLGVSFVLGIAVGLEHQSYPPELRTTLGVSSFVLFVAAGALCYRGFDTLWNLDQGEQVVYLPEEESEAIDNSTIANTITGPPTHLDHLLRNRDGNRGCE